MTRFNPSGGEKIVFCNGVVSMLCGTPAVVGGRECELELCCKESHCTGVYRMFMEVFNDATLPKRYSNNGYHSESRSGSPFVAPSRNTSLLHFILSFYCLFSDVALISAFSISFASIQVSIFLLFFTL